MVTSTPLQECSSTLPAPAESAFHARERGYSIAVEVTCHFPGPFQSEVLNFSSWRAPQEAPWLAVLSLWPWSDSPWPLLTGWSSLPASSTKNLYYNICNDTFTHCRGNVWNDEVQQQTMPYYNSWMWWKVLATGVRVPFFFLPSGSRFLCENSISTIDICPYLSQKTLKSYTKS